MNYLHGILSQCPGRPAPVPGRTASLLARRLSAYLIDWFVAILIEAGLVLIAAVLLLASSDLNRRDPPAWSIDAALALMSLWLPCWLLYHALSLSMHRATLGMSLSAIRIAPRPGVWRAFLRALLLCAFSFPLLAAPLLVALVVSLGTAGPWYVALASVILVLGSLAACASPVFSIQGASWLDRLTGTCIVTLGSGVAN
jgi:RDD family